MANVRIKLRTNENTIRINKPQVAFTKGGIEPIGTINIDTNGIHNVKYFEFANINVPIPEGYLKPYGIIEIKSTNEIDVSEYEKAKIVDENLKAENIAENVEVLGITGTFRGGIDTSDGDVTADDILLGKVAYAKEERIVGTIQDYDGSNSEGIVQEIDNLINRTITEYYNNRVTSIAPSVFYGYTTLVKVDFPNVTEIGATAFARTGLVEVNFPKVNVIGSQAFSNNSTLKKIYLPSMIDLTANSLREALGLEEVYLEEVNKISSNSLYACYMLKKLVITNKKQVPSLTNSATLSLCYHITGTINATYNPNGDKDGYIYVDDSLVEAYKVATNWSTFATQIKPLSELEVE